MRHKESSILLSGNEAVALAARNCNLSLGAGYPGTPSTEILEYLDEIGGKAQWAPNEKVALEVALGAAFGGGWAMATMKHVGLNVAADVLFTAAYSGVNGALLIVSADDPGMASSQNEQDNRRYAVAAGVPMFEPSDSQEAYDFTVAALELSARWRLPVMLRVTTRICHSKTLVRPSADPITHPPASFEVNRRGRVMIPAHAKGAHRQLRRKLAEIAEWNETCPYNQVIEGDRSLGIITSGVSFTHAREAAPNASVLKLGLTYPLPMEMIRQFAAGVERCLIVEENDPYFYEQIRTAGIEVEQKPEMYRFGELNVDRVRRIVVGDTSEEAAPAPGKPPALCVGCPHRVTFELLKKLNCIVSGDIGCYTLGVLPPFEAMDMQICMGASVGMGLGLRHVLPEDQARRVVSVIGDSTFVHSGMTGLADMVYNPPKTGHVLMILDNGTTAMTGLQEHPGTGRKLGHEPTNKLNFEELVRSLGIANVHLIDPLKEGDQLEKKLRDALAGNELYVFIVRRPCILAAGKIKQREKEEGESEDSSGQSETEASQSPIPNPQSLSPISIVIAGLGGQGVLKASDILADAAFLSGYDVKKSEIHGMSQRGGSVASDIRFGGQVHSPMIPAAEADYLVVLAEDQVENNRPRLREGGVLISTDAIKIDELPNKRSGNVAILGALSRHLQIKPAVWKEAIRRNLKPKLHEANFAAFDIGRNGS